MQELPRVLAVVGPTAAGKSRAAMELARATGASIFGCDSVQVYRGLDIGSAKASAADQAAVPHELIDLVDPDAEFSAGAYARAGTTALARTDRPVILCGGTGLYLRALCWRQSETGPGDLSREDPKRQAFERRWEAAEAAEAGAVAAELARRDAKTAADIHPRNVVRALRALWLCEVHQKPISEVRAADPPRLRVDLRCVVLEPAADALRARILARHAEMMARGWLGEVEKLLAAGYHPGHKSMRSLGYKQLCAHIGGELSLQEAGTAIERETWAYARRQRTWFRHQLPTDRTTHGTDLEAVGATTRRALEDFLTAKAPTAP